MAYIDESLSTGEEVAAHFQLHWVARIPLALWLLLGLVTFGLTWLIAVYEYLRLRHVEQGVTNKRVIFKTNTNSRKSADKKRTRIETVEIKQGVLGRMLGYGDIWITGRGTSDVVFRTVDDPMAVKRAIENISHPAA